jgi:hypothetical protein
MSKLTEIEVVGGIPVSEPEKKKITIPPKAELRRSSILPDDKEIFFIELEGKYPDELQAKPGNESEHEDK